MRNVRYAARGPQRPPAGVTRVNAILPGNPGAGFDLPQGSMPAVSIPDSAKPTIFARMRAVWQAEGMAGALGAVIVLALLVNTVELLCTSGLPAVYTQILVARAGRARLACHRDGGRARDQPQELVGEDAQAGDRRSAR